MRLNFYATAGNTRYCGCSVRNPTERCRCRWQSVFLVHFALRDLPTRTTTSQNQVVEDATMANGASGVHFQRTRTIIRCDRRSSRWAYTSEKLKSFFLGLLGNIAKMPAGEWMPESLLKTCRSRRICDQDDQYKLARSTRPTNGSRNPTPV